MVNELKTRLRDLMIRQTELMNTYSEGEAGVLEALRTRNWADLCGVLALLEEKTKLLTQIEEERHSVYLQIKAALGYTEDQSFYQVVSNFEPAEREIWSKMYRDLKFSVLRMQNVSFSINTYIYSVTGFLKDMVNILYPQTRGKIYSRKGKSNGASAMPLVIDRSL